jgi:hypothetical protein
MRDWIITEHAIDQYLSRWCEEKLDREEAQTVLLELLRGAKYSNKSAYGGMIWISGTRPDIRLLIKDTNVLITVLPPNKRLNTIDEIADYHSIQAEQTQDIQYYYESKLEIIKSEIKNKKRVIEKLNQKQKQLEKEKSDLLLDIIDLENNVKALSKLIG